MSSAVAVQILQAAAPLPQVAEDLARPTTVVAPTATNSEVMALFGQAPDLGAIVVVDQDRPLGLIDRHAFFDRFARPFYRDLFLKRSCTVFMDASPVLVDTGVAVNRIGQIVAESGGKGLNNGFLVTREGRFHGHCDGLSLLRVLADLQEEQHRQLLSSIDYARGIQKALLAESRAVLERTFPGGHAIDWEPRDVVGGDCFFAAEDETGTLVGLIDCTGHGVPGALLTSIALSELNRLAADPALRRQPGALMQGLNQRVKAALQQFGEAEGDADEGMDAAFVFIPEHGAQAFAASARLPITVFGPDGDVEVVKGERRGLGYRSTPSDFKWSEQAVAMGLGRRAVFATDGVCDQVGQAAQMAFGWTRFRAALSQGASGPAEEMLAEGRRCLEAWQGDEGRRDDITVLAIDLDGARR